MGAVGFLLAATYWPGLAGAAEASRWASLCVLVPIALFFVQVRLTVTHLVGGLLFGWAVLSLMWTPVWYDGVAALMQFIVLAGAVLIGASRGAGSLWKGLGYGLLLSSVVCVVQALGFQPVADTGSASSGLFVNPDVLAEITAVVFIALVFERSWLAVGLLPALFLTECRSALIAVFVVGAIAGWRKWRWRVLYSLPLLVGGVLLTATKWSNGDSPRLDMWRDTLAGLTTWGNGIGSFYSAFPKYATLTSDLYQPAHAHNDLLELAFELGVVPAALAIALLLALVWRANFKDRCLLIALGIMSMVGFPLHSPSTVFVFGIVEGCAARNWSVLRAFKFGGGYNLYKGCEQPDYATAGTCG